MPTLDVIRPDQLPKDVASPGPTTRLPSPPGSIRKRRGSTEERWCSGGSRRRGMPELSFAVDPERAYAVYGEQGYFCEPGLFSTVECDRIIAASAELPTA